MAPRFLIDENLSPLLARHLRTAHGFDAVHVQELGLRGVSGANILARAIADDRIIVTGNAADFRRHGANSGASGTGDHARRVGRAQQLTLGSDSRTPFTALEQPVAPVRDRPAGVRGLTNAEEGIIIKFLEPARRSRREKPVVLLKVLDRGRIFESAVSALVPYR